MGERVLVLGPGASGKSTFARALAARTGIPSIELDELFWSSDLRPMPPDQWARRQEVLCAGDRWILDGDLGPYDELATRLRRADSIVLIDLPTLQCAWRALRRSRERLDFWWWLLGWRRRWRPRLLRAIAAHAPGATLVVVGRPHELTKVLDRWPPAGDR